MRGSSTKIIKDVHDIADHVYSRSQKMYKYICNSGNQFTLYSKLLCHSDLTNRGKRNGPQEGLDKNYLYYLSIDEMLDIQDSENKTFENAKQSNIGLPHTFYEDLEIPRLERRQGKQSTYHTHIILNNYVNVRLVNETLEYFNQNFTKQVLKALKKDNKLFNNFKEISIDKAQDFTDIQLTQAIHGLGTAKDVLFHQLRLSMFLNDRIIFLIEHSKPRKNLFILLEKNPVFFNILKLKNSKWLKFLAQTDNQRFNKIDSKKNINFIEEEKTRKYQSQWKDKLAAEMMTYTTVEGEVFCPFTQIRANYDDFSMLFIASHIKRHTDCESNQESFDLNNGLLLSANADALFDKYMISISEDKKFLFSFLLKNNYQLISNLLLGNPLFDKILNDERMKNLAEHRRIFFEKEEERRNHL